MRLPKDLREMNEEQFVEMFNLLKDKTKNFEEFTPELLIENNQFLLIVRCCLGLSQRELAGKLKCTKDWVRHTERGRNKIEDVLVAKRWAPKIEKLMRNGKICLNKTLEFWKKFNT